MLQAAYLMLIVVVMMAGIAWVCWRGAQGRGGIRGPGFVWSREDIGAAESNAISKIERSKARTLGAGGGSWIVTFAPTNERGAVDVRVQMRHFGFAQNASAVLVDGKYSGLKEGRKLVHWITLWQFLPLALLVGLGISLAITAWRQTGPETALSGFLLVVLAGGLMWWSANQRKAAVRSALRLLATDARK